MGGDINCSAEKSDREQAQLQKIHLIPPEQDTKSLSLFSIRKDVAQRDSHCSPASGVGFPNSHLSTVGLDGTQGSPQKCWAFGK